MPFIDSSWPEYFKTRHEGLGTTYERFILHRLFEELQGSHSVESVLEAPSFGMTGISGINSLWWATQGVETTVVDHHPDRLRQTGGVWEELCLPVSLILTAPGYDSLPFEDQQFDLSWNFAALWYVNRLENFLAQLVRVSRKAVLLCIPNRANPLFAIRRRRLRKTHDLFTSHINPPSIIHLMGRLGWRLVRRGYFDTPPWPDIAMNKEDLLGPLARPPTEPLNILDHYSGRDKGLQARVLRFDALEKLPGWIKRFWAHHEHLLFTPGGREPAGGPQP
jgi:SAM-dependent methyltransferase